MLLVDLVLALPATPMYSYSLAIIAFSAPMCLLVLASSESSIESGLSVVSLGLCSKLTSNIVDTKIRLLANRSFRFVKLDSGFGHDEHGSLVYRDNSHCISRDSAIFPLLF